MLLVVAHLQVVGPLGGLHARNDRLSARKARRERLETFRRGVRGGLNEAVPVELERAGDAEAFAHGGDEVAQLGKRRLMIGGAHKRAKIMGGCSFDPGDELTGRRRQIVDRLAHESAEALFIAGEVRDQGTAHLAVMERCDGERNGAPRLRGRKSCGCR